MNNILEDLKKYFQDTPQEQIMKEWAETEKYDKVGPSIEEFLIKTKLYFKLEDEDLGEGIENVDSTETEGEEEEQN